MTLYSPYSSSLNPVEVWGSSGQIRKEGSVCPPAAVCLLTYSFNAKAPGKNIEADFSLASLVASVRTFHLGRLGEKNKMIPLSFVMSKTYGSEEAVQKASLTSLPNLAL